MDKIGLKIKEKYYSIEIKPTCVIDMVGGWQYDKT